MWSIASYRQSYAQTAIPPYEVSWRPDGQQLAVGSHEFKVTFYDSNLNLIAERAAASRTTKSIVWSPDQTKIAVAGTGLDSFLEIWDATDYSTLLSVQIVGSETSSLAWSPDSTKIILAEDRWARVRDTATGQMLAELNESHFAGTKIVHWHSQNEWILTVDSAGLVRIWDAITYQLIQSFTNDADGAVGVLGVIISPDEAQIAMPTRIGTALEGTNFGIWQISDGQRLADFRALSRSALATEWHGTQIAILDFDNIIKIWDTNTFALVNEVDLQANTWAMAWSPDGSRLVYVSAGGEIEFIETPQTSSK